jgi:SAM-dependent methyltransferase
MTVPLAPGARLRWSVVSAEVRALRPASILELGCGGGGFATRLVAMTDRYAAVEPDETSWRLAHDRVAPLGGTVLHGDQTAATGTYDLVCAFEVLEHLEDDATALKQWLPLVRPGGHLLLSTPAGPSRMGPWDLAVGHYRRYSPADITAKLTAAGGTDVQVRCYGWPIGYVLENVRNRLATRRGLAARGSVEERTASSARQMQPSTRLAGALVTAATTPFAVVQRAVPTRGVALIARATRP